MEPGTDWLCAVRNRFSRAFPIFHAQKTQKQQQQQQQKQTKTKKQKQTNKQHQQQ